MFLTQATPLFIVLTVCAAKRQIRRQDQREADDEVDVKAKVKMYVDPPSPSTNATASIYLNSTGYWPNLSFKSDTDISDMEYYDDDQMGERWVSRGKDFSSFLSYYIV